MLAGECWVSGCLCAGLGAGRAGEDVLERELRGLELPVCKGQVVRRVTGRSVRSSAAPGTGRGAGGRTSLGGGGGAWTSPEAYAVYSETPGGRTAVGPEGGNMKGHPSPLEPPLPAPVPGGSRTHPK